MQSPVFMLILRWSVVLALWAFLISMAIGQYGLSNYRALLNSKTELESIVAQLSFQNQMMQQKIEVLKNSEEHKLRYLKENFGLVSPGEMVFHFKNNRN